MGNRIRILSDSIFAEDTRIYIGEKDISNIVQEIVIKVDAGEYISVFLKLLPNDGIEVDTIAKKEN